MLQVSAVEVERSERFVTDPVEDSRTPAARRLGKTWDGTIVMVVGAEVKALCNSYHALGQTAPLSKEAQVKLVGLSFACTVSLSVTACLWSLETGRLSKKIGLEWSLETGRLSKKIGLDWEVYLLLFCCGGFSLLVQSVMAVAWLKAGDRFDAAAFPVASMSILPFISDQFDTLKDIIFGALCFQSEHWAIQSLGVLSWLYLLAFHAWFVFCKTLNRAVQNGNLIAAKTIWEEAEVGEDIQLFQRMLPRLLFVLDELDKLSEGELKAWRGFAEMLMLGEAKCNLEHQKIGNSGAKALGDGLKENGSLLGLDLSYNSIGDAGAEAPGLGGRVVEPRGGVRVAGPCWSCGQEGG
eukprot:s374_g40.t1